MRDTIVRSTPFRLTLILGATFFAALAIAGMIAFELIQNELAQRMDRTLKDTFDVIAQAYGDSDQTDLIDSVNSHAHATLDHDHIYALIGSDGSILAGNLSAAPDGIGLITVSARSLGIGQGSDGRYRALVGLVDGNRLLVGQSFVESTDIARLALTSLAWASTAILVLVMATGAVIAVRAQRRIEGIARIMARVGQGELAARMPVSERGDDIDQLAQQVNTALERLGHLIEGIRQVSVDIAHDLKTPLNRLAITVEAAINAEGVGLPTTGLLGQAELEIHQINSTFDALLRIAQIEAGARRARFVRLHLMTVLDRIGEAYVDVAEERGQFLSMNCPRDLPDIEGDADLLTQLCANLIENSMRHCPRGTRIDVSADLIGERSVVTFADDGPGIPEAERSKVFQRLYRVDKSRTTSGSGLGLSLVKAIADLHGAEISIGDNAPGLRVEVAFPVQAPRLQSRAGAVGMPDR